MRAFAAVKQGRARDRTWHGFAGVPRAPAASGGSGRRSIDRSMCGPSASDCGSGRAGFGSG